MTKEEAIYILRNTAWLGENEQVKKVEEAIDTAERLIPNKENKMDDLISRQAAIDAYGDWYVEEGTEEGFIGTVKQLLEGLPSAQQEIIRCKDCKYSYAMITAKSKDGQERWIRFCDKHKNWYPKDDWFCADGERKEDG